MTPDEPRNTPRRAAPDDVSLTLSEDMMAAEYVLGTLDPDERDDAKARIASDFSFAALVRYWERRLGELHALTGDVEPPAAVWEAIKAKLATVAPSAEMRLPDVAPPVAPPAAGDVVALRERLVRWRNLAAFAASLAASLLLFVVMQLAAPGLLPARLRPKPEATAPTTARAEAVSSPRFVAVLQREATAPAFVLTVDVASRSLTMRRVSAPREPGKSYELWLISSKFPAPRSLGLVGTGDFTQASDLPLEDPGSIGDATFAVSLEPEGGSPTGAPSNVIFLGKPVASTPPPASRSEAR
jgi:anti-sigma-K factor RskA